MGTSYSNNTTQRKSTKARASKPAPCISFPDKYWVFAADFSLKRPGFARFHVDRTNAKDGEDPVISELFTSCVDNKLDREKCHGQILDEIFFGLGAFRPKDDLHPELMDPVFYVREKGIHVQRSKNTEGAIYEVVGVSNLWLWQYTKQWYEINPKHVKKVITDFDEATKETVANYLKLYVGDYKFANDDESDATAVGLAWLIDNGQIKNKLKEKAHENTERNLANPA